MTPKVLEEIKKFNLDKTVLILDRSAAIRRAIETCLNRLGIDSGNIGAFSRLPDAMTYINKERPSYVFTEFQIGDRFGLELIQELDRAGIPVTERAFFMVTGNSQDSAVAEAAEEDVDAYILKPFSLDSIEEQVVRIIEDKMHPSPYHAAVQDARKLIDAKDPSGAIDKLKHSLGLVTKSALAYFYLGQCFEILNENEKALNYYRLGLKQHPGHYKCSLGEFETLEKMGKRDEAYAVISELLKKYPLTPKRLGKVFILAVYTKHFADIEQFYELFLGVERRTEELIKIVSAGLYACGKYFCSIKKFDKASEVFKKSCIASGRSADYLRKVIETLLSHRQSDFTFDFLAMYSAEEQTTNDWKALEFQISCITNPPDRSIQKGRKLISEGINEVSVFIETAKLLLLQDKKDHAENVIFTGIERCPQYRAELLKLLD